jgi:hypothetical protein
VRAVEQDVVVLLHLRTVASGPHLRVMGSGLHLHVMSSNPHLHAMGLLRAVGNDPLRIKGPDMVPGVVLPCAHAGAPVDIALVPPGLFISNLALVRLVRDREITGMSMATTGAGSREAQAMKKEATTSGADSKPRVVDEITTKLSAAFHFFGKPITRPVLDG